MRQQQAAVLDRALIAEDDGAARAEAHLVIEPVEAQPDARGHHCGERGTYDQRCARI